MSNTALGLKGLNILSLLDLTEFHTVEICAKPKGCCDVLCLLLRHHEAQSKVSKLGHPVYKFQSNFWLCLPTHKKDSIAHWLIVSVP